MNDALNIEPAIQAQIDRLVAGELPELERSRVLDWLDEDARRWRVCTVAFLEAQCWEESTMTLGQSGRGSPSGERQCDELHSAAKSTELRDPATLRSSARPTGQRPRYVVALAVAAGLLMAFLAGLAAGRVSPVGAPHQESPFVNSAPQEFRPADNDQQPLLATVEVRSQLDPRVPMRLQLPVSETDPANTHSAITSPTPAMSEYERMQWERRGYEVTEVVRYLPARLSDGREVVVPVTSRKIQFKGRPVL